MRIYLSVLIIAISLSSAAQEAAKKIDTLEANPIRPRASDELNKESSSFVPDPDSLDPLPVKKENLKEDVEPVLEDIRQVLDAPSTARPNAKPKPKLNAKAAATTSKLKKKSKPTNKISTKARFSSDKKNVSDKTSSSQNKSIASGKRRKSKTTAKLSARGLRDDGPDFTIENDFHKIYKTYNAEPTSSESWSSVLKGRDSEIYKVQKNDTLWSISKTLFGDPNYWPKLWSLNKRGIVNPHFITPGLQVMFYSGSSQQIPSLAVATANDSDGATESTDSKNSLKEIATAKKNNSNARQSVTGNRQPSPIPDSLPISRNDKFFLPQKVLKVEFMNQPNIPEIFINDIILADRKIVSEVEVTEDEILKGRCGGDHVLKTSQLQGSEGTLKIYESLQNLETDAGEIFPYRYVGEAQVLSEQKIRITACTTVISPSLYFVSPSKVESWRTNKTSMQARPVIIGSPNIVDQLIFTNHQFAYINLGPQNAEIGQTVQVQSQLTERTSGKIRIVDKFGSFAIGIVTDVQDLIETGDEVQLQ